MVTLKMRGEVGQTKPKMGLTNFRKSLQIRHHHRRKPQTRLKLPEIKLRKEKEPVKVCKPSRNIRRMVDSTVPVWSLTLSRQRN